MTPFTPRPWLGLAGPTASGKTSAALAIAREAAALGLPPIEIISVDSALVYRGMDIGTAKPSADERAEVPHHLIDLIEPTAAYSAAEFSRAATELVGQIHARGALPLLVGGTMLYVKAWLDGIDPLPAADAAVRAQIDARAAQLGWPALHAELAQIDPVTAARLAPGDSQRIQRALEVFELSGQPLSSLHTRLHPREAAESTAPDWLDHGTLFALEPASRPWLHARIAERFDAMLAAGLVDEVRRLRARGDLHADLPAMRCVGYRQTWVMLDGLAAGGAERAEADDAAWPLPPHALATLREAGIAATRQLAKRQLTWLRGMPRREVIASDQPGWLEALRQRVAAIAPTLRAPSS